MRLIMNIVLAVFISFIAAQSVAAAQSGDLLSHRAIYELQLERASSKTSLTHLSGRIVYDFSGSTCEGFTAKFRFVSRFESEGAPPRLNDQQMTSFESADGTKFRFLNKSYTDQELTKEVEGEAQIQAGKTIVDLTKPKQQHHELPLAQFPNGHTLDLIKRAEKGEVFYQADLYDGSDDATKISYSTVIIGKQREAQRDEENEAMGAYGGEPIWPVTISYFDDTQNRDGLPIYRTSFLLHKNGITRDLLMDYGDFAIRGKLVQLDVPQNGEAAANCPP